MVEVETINANLDFALEVLGKCTIKRTSRRTRRPLNVIVLLIPRKNEASWSLRLAVGAPYVFGDHPQIA
jgi:hypothetical protein